MFIYVFSRGARDELIARGLKIVKSDDLNERYIFVSNSGSLLFADFKHKYALSDVLTF